MDILVLVNLVITIALTVGGVLAYRYGFARTASEIQERVIHALKNEIETLQDRIEALEKENMRLSQTIAVIRTALKQRGLSVTIDGDVVSISDGQGHSTHMSRIQNTGI